MLSVKSRLNGVERLISRIERTGGACSITDVELMEYCNYDCLKCKHCFAYGGWCNTKVTPGECMYYECRSIYDDIDVPAVFSLNDADYQEAYNNALKLWRDSDYMSVPFLKNRLKISHEMAVSIYKEILG